MKTILVTTDFSPASVNAFQYALKLADGLNARLVLFHAFQQVTIPTMEAALMLSLEDTEKIVRKRLEDIIDEADNPQHITVSLQYAEGPAASAIRAAAAQQKANLIVTGMKEHGRLMRHIFGSTVTDLAKSSQIPMIVVPENITYQAPEKIVLASDIAPETDYHTLDVLQAIGQQFKAKVFIVRVISDRFEEAFELLNRPSKFIRLTRAVDTTYEFTRNNDITQALNEFIAERGIHMIAMIPHRHALLESWFYPSQTRNMLFKSPVPILVLPEKRHTFHPAEERQEKAEIW